MMNFQLTSQQRLFVFKVEFSISEGVPASKVFTTWEAHSDGKLQVGLRACTGSGVLGTAPNLPLASNEETGSLRGRGASHWIVASEPGEAPTPAFPLLCLFECDSIRGRLPEIHENPLYY